MVGAEEGGAGCGSEEWEQKEKVKTLPAAAGDLLL